MMNKSIFVSVGLLIQSGFGQVVTDVTCNTSRLAPIKGPAVYIPRLVAPPDHDLPGDPLPQPVHRGVNLDVWHNSPDQFAVGGMALLANGEMLELDYNGALYLVTDLDSAGTVGRQVILNGLVEPLGLLLRNNREVYISTSTAILSYIFDGATLSQRTVLLNIPTRSGWYVWNSDLEMDANYLYAGLGSRGTIGRYSWATRTWDLDYAVAMRNSHGMGKDDSGRIWFSDNQGNYRPASPIFLLKAGKSYGVPTLNWTTGAASLQNSLGPTADVEAFRNDLIWIPYNGMSQSSTDIHFMKSGPFRGQALVGDNRTGHLNRIMVERVAGQMQGAVVRMTGGLEAGAYRIVEDVNGNYYVGGLGTGSSYWSWCSRYKGFQKLAFKTGFSGNTLYNDVHTVSLVQGGLLVSFTSDIGADFLSPSNYRAYTFNYIKSVTGYYGGPKMDSVAAAITGIVRRSNREILININGLLPESVLGLEFRPNLTVNNNLQSYELFYTTNRLSTVVPTDVLPRGETLSHGSLKLGLNRHILFVEGLQGSFSEPEIFDLKGTVHSQLNFQDFAQSGKVDVSPLRKGLYFIRLRAGNQFLVKPFVIQ